MLLSLAPWYYRNLLIENLLIEIPLHYEVELLDGKKRFESSVTLNASLRPSWLEKSFFYRNSDGAGCSEFKNIAVYKGISEALERWAFYEKIDSEELTYKFNLNPTTTGMAAYPYFNASIARILAREEAIERWSIHEFNRCLLPIAKCETFISNLNYYKIITPFRDITVTLLEYYNGTYFSYGFAASSIPIKSFEKALVELDRNIRVLTKSKQAMAMNDTKFLNADKTLLFFSTLEGNRVFNELILKAPKAISSMNPKVICDLELKGGWSKYTRVWRYLLENSYCSDKDEKFFMF